MMDYNDFSKFTLQTTFPRERHKLLNRISGKCESLPPRPHTHTKSDQGGQTPQHLCGELHAVSSEGESAGLCVVNSHPPSVSMSTLPFTNLAVSSSVTAKVRLLFFLVFRPKHYHLLLGSGRVVWSLVTE